MCINRNVIYKDSKGYITGYLTKDGYMFINKFVVHSRYRGTGYARELAKYIPQKAKLWPFPLFKFDEENILNHEQLIKFYSSLGFTEASDPFLNLVMIRH